MTTYRHRKQEAKSGAVAAVGVLLVLLAAGVLYGAYRWVKRKQPAPAPVAAEPEVGLTHAETPFDNALIDPETGAFVMVVEVPTRPDDPGEARLLEAVAACLSFRDEARLYPEAEGREQVVRVLFHYRPTPRLLERLPLGRVQVWAYGPDQKPRPLGGLAQPEPVPASGPEKEPEPEPAEPAAASSDLVLEDPDTGAVVLVLIQEEPWDDAATANLQRRVDGCLQAVKTGALAKQIDVGDKIEIHVHCREPPGPTALAALRRLRRTLRPDGVGFRVVRIGALGEEEVDLDR